MKKIVLISALVLAAVFALNAQAASVDKHSTVNANPVVIGFYGDSTIRGYKAHSGDQVLKSTPDAFAEALAKRPGIVVRNEGADSSRVEHLLAGSDGKHPAWAQYLPNSGVDIVITNHASKNGNPVTQYKADMRTMIDIARAHGKAIILMTPNPISEGGLEAYVHAMRELAIEERVPLIDVFRYLQGYMAQTGKTIQDIVPDGYHPAEEIYVMVGKYAAKEFQRIRSKQLFAKRNRKAD